MKMKKTYHDQINRVWKLTQKIPSGVFPSYFKNQNPVLNATHPLYSSRNAFIGFATAAFTACQPSAKNASKRITATGTRCIHQLN
jgi:hypothetical protein